MFISLNEYLYIKENEIRFDDYPKSAIADAQKALDWKKEKGDEVKGGTQVGWERANQLVNGENLSFETVKRMKAFFDRHQKNKAIKPELKDEPWKDNGYIAWLIWGGDSAWEWAKKKIEQVEKQEDK